MLRAYVRCKNIAIFGLVEMTFKLLGEVELQMGKEYCCIRNKRSQAKVYVMYFGISSI